jgi:uncharacterized membrane protein YoaK (UPF0700 family)
VKLLAAGLSALAGFVDATGFLALGGFFVSFMSGNTTRLAVGLAGARENAAIAAGLILCFVLGVMAGTLVGQFLGATAPARRAASVLALVTLLLAAAAILGELHVTAGMGAALALAMGAENTVFEREGEVHIGLTYMTGTLVKLGQHLTRAITGGPRWAWRPYLLLWLGLAAGAVMGALAWHWLGVGNLWLAAAAAALLTLAARRILQPGVFE